KPFLNPSRPHCATNMALPQHHPRMLLAAVLLMLALGRRVTGRSSPISDLKSKISGVEELLEEFRQQLQQEQSYKVGGVTDSCVGDFGSLGDSIIQTRPSIEQGAAFLLVPDRVFTWKDCLHACCSQPHCTVAVVREDPRQPGKSLKCYLFNCTYRNKHCPDRSDEDFCSDCEERQPAETVGTPVLRHF
uniref:MANSC domain-containing protein n=1 Tax=Takifugu rubripes TaxID=31033 RepID=H2RSF3_TAKRU